MALSTHIIFFKKEENMQLSKYVHYYTFLCTSHILHNRIILIIPSLAPES